MTMPSGESILVIDDDRTVLTYLKGVLGREGFRVFTALDALQGPMVARQAKPDLVILDLSMPGGGGTAVLERLRRMQGTMQTPVLVYSGLARERVAELVNEAQDVMVVPKSGSPEDLLSAVHQLIRGH